MQTGWRQISVGAAPLLLAVLTSCRTVPSDRVTLDALRSEFDLSRPKRINGMVELKHGDRSLTFRDGSRQLLVGNTLIWMNAGAMREGRRWTLSHADRTDVILPLLHPEEILYRLDASRVVIDPGHGGNDPGALAASGLHEADTVYDVAERVRKRLTAEGVTATLTRHAEQGLTHAARNARARREAADLFVSIHANSAPSSTADGCETFVLPSPGYPSTAGNGEGAKADPANRWDQGSIILGYQVQRLLAERTPSPDRGVKRARYAVLREAHCPAILVEIGFLSHKEEAARLGTGAYRQLVADAIADGILTYRAWIEASHRLMLETLTSPENTDPEPTPDTAEAPRAGKQS